jgi:hypothetical protein
MELYTLDSLFRRTGFVVENYESLIWTERYADVGDFELVMPSSLANKNRFPPGTKLGLSESKRVMEIETVGDEDKDGGKLLTFKGPSLESILDQRIARAAMSDIPTDPTWSLSGTPAAIARKIFHDICVTGILDVSDVIPNIYETNPFTVDTIAEPTGSLDLSIEPQSVLSAIKQLCDQYGMGFRLAKNLDESQLYFNIYMGSDRTSRQTTVPAVIFSPGLDNLNNTSEVKSISSYKNVAYVFGQTGYAVVYPEGVDPATVTGLDRRVLMVNASDIDDLDPPTLAANLHQRGLDELAKNRQVSAFDGEISQHSSYLYGRDYNLGDLVELQNSTGSSDDMRVTEQIFVSDREGERRYPTLTLNQYIQPGTWAAWDFGQVWQDLGATEYWADQE